MTVPRSFTKFYWAVWLVALALYALGASTYSSRTALGCFALVAGVGAAYVFHFEFGRLMGFLKANCPSQHAELARQPLLEFLAFVHPHLIRKVWQASRSSVHLHEAAFLVYRSAWLFSAVSLAVIVVLVTVAH